MHQNTVMCQCNVMGGVQVEDGHQVVSATVVMSVKTLDATELVVNASYTAWIIENLVSMVTLVTSHV